MSRRIGNWRGGYPAESGGARIGYDQGLSHRIEAGCDFYLMPSRFEPCGLNQMYSLRYRTIPIVRATGRLDDTITRHQRKAGGPRERDQVHANIRRALAKAIRKALALYRGNRSCCGAFTG